MHVQLPFDDRLAAARELAKPLAHLGGERPLILAVPRGAVPMGRWIADALGGELDVALVRKLGAPGHPELAVGAIDEDGGVRIEHFARQLGAHPDYMQAETERQLDVIRARRRTYSPLRPAIDPWCRNVIVVDDGMATGATMSAALNALRDHRPARLICAVPVATETALRRIERLADHIVCLATPPDFRSIAQFYRSFEPVSHAMVTALLAADGGRGQPLIGDRDAGPGIDEAPVPCGRGASPEVAGAKAPTTVQ